MRSIEFRWSEVFWASLVAHNSVDVIIMFPANIFYVPWTQIITKLSWPMCQKIMKPQNYLTVLPMFIILNKSNKQFQKRILSEQIYQSWISFTKIRLFVYILVDSGFIVWSLALVIQILIFLWIRLFLTKKTATLTKKSCLTFSKGSKKFLKYRTYSFGIAFGSGLQLNKLNKIFVF